MKIIDGENAVLGRLASYVAKEAIKGEEFVIVNCEKVIVTGDRLKTQEHFKEKKSRVGWSQKGPKHSVVSYKIVKRCIRGMLPEHRWGRGKDLFKKIKCYNGVPKEFESVEKIKFENTKKCKYIQVKEIYKNGNRE